MAALPKNIIQQRCVEIQLQLKILQRESSIEDLKSIDDSTMWNRLSYGYQLS